MKGQVRKAYELWAPEYDAVQNRTRDLDSVVLRQQLQNLISGVVLEVGCGTGKNTVWLAKHSVRLLGLDFSAAMLAKARRKIADPNISLLNADVTVTWPCPDGCFDWVLFNLVLEHLADIAPVFLEAARVVKQGGCIYVSELHPFRQYRGSKARYRFDGYEREIPATMHHFSDYFNAAHRAGLRLQRLEAHWDSDGDEGSLPRLMTLLFAN